MCGLSDSPEDTQCIAVGTVLQFASVKTNLAKQADFTSTLQGAGLKALPARRDSRFTTSLAAALVQ
jgi:hypothetical protein